MDGWIDRGDGWVADVVAWLRKKKILGVALVF